MYPDNSWYGHRRILAEYCAVPAARPIFGSVYHGWAHRHGADEGFRRITTAPWFVWNERDLAAAGDRGVPNVRCIGSPFAYLMAMRFPEGVPASPGTGTLAFPSHSAEQVTSSIDATAFVESVESTSPGPYTACVYYQDLDRPGTQTYRVAGWRVVSLGTRANPFFLDALVDEVLRHQHVASNMVQTAVWYSALLRRSVRIVGPPDAMAVTHGVGPEAEALWPSLYAAAFDPHASTRQAAFELGVARTLPPAGLRRELGWSDWRSRASAHALRPVIDARIRWGSRRS